MEKTCTKCKLLLPLDSFPIVNYKTMKRSSLHIDCKRKQDREYYNNYTKEQKNKKYKIQVERLNEIRKFLYRFLLKKKCIDCGEKRIATLDFDHRHNKCFSVSSGVKNGYSLKKIKNEIRKCDIRCANCHRIKTAINFNWYNFNK